MIIEVADCCLFSFFSGCSLFGRSHPVEPFCFTGARVSTMFFLSKTGFYYFLFYIYTILHLYGRRQTSPFSYIEYFQLSLYLICYYQTKQGWIFIHPYQDYIYNRLLGNDGATRWHHSLNLVFGRIAAAYHSDGFKRTAVFEHGSYGCKILYVPAT